MKTTGRESQQRGRLLILGICCTSLFLTTMDITIVNVALPTIRADLNASITGLQWILDAYTLTIACLLMLSGSIADRFGRQRIFLIGLGVFTVSSLLCSFSPSESELIIFRVAQAVGASMMNPVALSIVTAAFPEPAARARATGTWTAVAGFSMALGPVVGGLLTSVMVSSRIVS